VTVRALDGEDEKGARDGPANREPFAVVAGASSGIGSGTRAWRSPQTAPPQPLGARLGKK